MTPTQRSWVPKPLARSRRGVCRQILTIDRTLCSHSDVKPLAQWQRICEHHIITQIVDSSLGSVALAIAAAGAMVYEGVAANDVHREWLGSTLDRCVMYLAGQKREFVPGLGADADFIYKVRKYFAGTMIEARMLLEPADEGGQDEYLSSDESQS